MTRLQIAVLLLTNTTGCNSIDEREKSSWNDTENRTILCIVLHIFPLFFLSSVGPLVSLVVTDIVILKR